jgi:hypothetical protein
MPPNPAAIVRTGRAIMSALQPLTGERAEGQMRLRAKEGQAFDLPRYTYFTPLIDRDNHPSWYFKVGQGPNEDGSWRVDDSGDTLVDVYSNLGGARHNIAASTRLTPELKIVELDESSTNAPKAEADFTGGTDPETFAFFRDMAFYEQLDGPAMTTDLARSPIREFPACLLAFDDMTPADGVAISQVNQGAVNAGDGTKFFKIGYSLSIIVNRSEGEAYRRHEGLLLADKMIHELNDRHAAPDGEVISNPGGIQVRQLMREVGDQKIYQKFYIYTLFISCMQAVTRTDRRVYNPLLRASVTVQRRPDASPATEAQTDAFTLVNDMQLDMTPGQLDLAIDGIFTRASAATLFRAGVLNTFAAGIRRTYAPGDGVYLEPEITNPLGNAAQDFTLWTLDGGTAVGAPSVDDPLEVINAANVVTFPDTATPLVAISLAGQVATVGEPIIFSVFARSPGHNTKTKFRMGLNDGVSEIASGDFVADATWRRFAWRVTPQAALVTLRLNRQSDGRAHNVAFWGASFNNDARWGAEYAFTTKAQDRLVFGPRPTGAESSAIDTPLSVLTGTWTLEWHNDDVPCAMVGVGLVSPKLVSVGDGATELFTLELYGTPAVGGATLVARTRGDGVVLTLNGVKWPLSSRLRFTVNAKGSLTISGTNGHDGIYDFPRYDLDADLVNDYLVVGDDSAGTSAPTPGFFAVVIGA